LVKYKYFRKCNRFVRKVIWWKYLFRWLSVVQVGMELVLSCSSWGIDQLVRWGVTCCSVVD